MDAGPSFKLRPVVFDSESEDDDGDRVEQVGNGETLVHMRGGDGAPERTSHDQPQPQPQPRPQSQGRPQAPGPSAERADAREASTGSSSAGGPGMVLDTRWDGTRSKPFVESIRFADAEREQEYEHGDQPLNVAAILRADPDTRAQMLHSIAPTVLQPMGIVASPWSYEQDKNAEAPTMSTSTNVADAGSQTQAQAQTQIALSRQRRASESEPDLALGAPPTPASTSAPTGPFTGPGSTADKRSRGRQAAPPDPSAGYRPREGHEYHPRDAPSQPHSQPQLQRRQSVPAAVPAPAPAEDVTGTVVRHAMDAVSREAARAGALKSQLDRALLDNDTLRTQIDRMMRDFEAQLQSVVRETMARAEEMFKQQNDRMRVMEEKLKHTKAERDALIAQRAARQAEIEAGPRNQIRFVPHVTMQAGPTSPVAVPTKRTSPPQLAQAPPPPPPPASTTAHTATTAPPARRYDSPEGPGSVERRRQRLEAIQASLQGDLSNQSTRGAGSGYGSTRKTPANVVVDGEPPVERERRARQASISAANGPGAPPTKRRRIEPREPDGGDTGTRLGGDTAREGSGEDEDVKSDEAKLRGVYGEDSAGNYVCKLCTSQRGTGGGNVGFLKETKTDVLVAHAKASHRAVWDKVGQTS